MRRSRLAAGLSVLVIAYTVRLIYLHQIASSVLFDFLQLDPLYYYQWATRIAAGDWLGSEVFEMSPLYSYLLAVHLLVFGSDLWILRLVQIAVGSLTCLLTFLLGARLFNTRVGLLAGLACAVYGPLLFYEGQVMKEFLTPALATGALLLICSPRARAGAAARRGPWLGAGALLGLAALVRGNFLLLILILAVWAFFAAGRRFTFVVPFAFGTALVLLPVAARNYAVSGDLVLTTSGGGEVFYIGNGPFANGAYVPPPWVRSNPMYEHQDFRDKAEEITGRPLTRAEASRFWWRRTAAWILRHPGRTALLWMRKFALFWNDHELPDNYSYDTFTRFSPLLSRMLTFGPVALLAWVGLLWSARDAGRLVPLYLVLAGYMTSVLLFFNFARFRLPAVPILCVFAAFGAEQIFLGLRAWWRRRRLDWRPVISALLLVFAGPFMYIDWSSSADE
ncbi:MAG: glycosyltransferase family 39 protein, partial [Acidobacteriota bacterium]